jgi:hypothetical protein
LEFWPKILFYENIFSIDPFRFIHRGNISRAGKEQPSFPVLVMGDSHHNGKTDDLIGFAHNIKGGVILRYHSFLKGRLCPSHI